MKSEKVELFIGTERPELFVGTKRPGTLRRGEQVYDSVEWDKRDHAMCALYFCQSTLPSTGMGTLWDSRNNHSESFGMREVVERLPGVQPELPAQWHPPPKPSYVLFMAHENLLVSTRIW